MVIASPVKNIRRVFFFQNVCTVSAILKRCLYRLHFVYLFQCLHLKQYCESEFILTALNKISNAIGYFLFTDCSVQGNEELRIILINGLQYGELRIS